MQHNKRVRVMWVHARQGRVFCSTAVVLDNIYILWYGLLFVWPITVIIRLVSVNHFQHLTSVTLAWKLSVVITGCRFPNGRWRNPSHAFPALTPQHNNDYPFTPFNNCTILPITCQIHSVHMHDLTKAYTRRTLIKSISIHHDISRQ